MSKKRIGIVIVIAALLGSYFFLGLDQYLTLEFVQSRLGELERFRDENFVLTAGLYFCLYVLATALSIPGALIITLLGGAIFGLFWGTLLVSFASSIGATLAFLVSRTLLKDKANSVTTWLR